LEGGCVVPRKSFNALEYDLIKCHTLAEILKERPQCKDCEHMNIWEFSPDYYFKAGMAKHCQPCPKYKEIKSHADT
jgi:hypothetical protein